MDPNSIRPEVETIISSNKNSLIKRLVIIAIICLVLAGSILAVLYYFKIINLPKFPLSSKPKDPVVLIINDQQISQKTYEDRFAYLKIIRDIKDRNLAKKITTQSFIEDYILQQEAGKNNIEISSNEVDQYLKTSSVSASLTNSPDYKNDLRNTLIRKKLEPLIVASRSGKYIIVAFGFDVKELAGVNQKELALTKITETRNKIIQGADFDTVGKKLDQDPKVQLLNRGNSMFDFTLEPNTDALYSQGFKDAIFDVEQAGGLTKIVTLQNDPLKWHRKAEHTEFGFAFAKIDSITAGKASSYNAWLSEQSELLTIKDNINYEL